MYNSYYSSPSYYSSSAATGASAGGVMAFFLVMQVLMWILSIAAAVLVIVARWQTFKKLNAKGWESLIPGLNDIIEMDASGMERYLWFINYGAIICGIGPIVFMFWKSILLAKAFGKGTGFGILLAIFPFVGYPILAWSKAEYVGVNGVKAATTNNTTTEE